MSFLLCDFFDVFKSFFGRFEGIWQKNVFFAVPKFIGGEMTSPLTISDYSAGIEILKIVKKLENFRNFGILKK